MTIFVGGMVTIPKWVVYDFVLPTLLKVPEYLDLLLDLNVPCSEVTFP
jgi:hypothetical protein